MNAKYKMIVLDCPIDSMSDPFSREIFSKIIDLKIRGYSRVYEYGMLPVDTSDFVATHCATFEIINNEYIPLMAYKTTPLSRLKVFNLHNPLVAIAKYNNSEKHAQIVEEFVEKNNNLGFEVYYNGGFTISPDIIKDPIKRKFAWDMMTSFHAFNGEYNQSPKVIGGGTVRFKMEEKYEHMGYKAMYYNGEKLPPLPVFFAHNDLTQFIQIEETPEEAKKISSNYQELWEDRLIINKDYLSENTYNIRKKAA